MVYHLAYFFAIFHFCIFIFPSHDLNIIPDDNSLLFDSFILKAVLLTQQYFHLQVLCEDIYRPQGVGADGASQPGRLADRQLLQWPDSACLGGRLERVQSRIAGAWTCGRVYRLGSWQCSPHHPRGHRLRGMYSCVRVWHLPTEDVWLICRVSHNCLAMTNHMHWNNDHAS